MKSITKHSTSVGAKILFNVLKELGYENIKEFQEKFGLVSDGYFGNKSYDVLYNDLLNVEKLNFTDYYHSDYAKKQIIWHHAAGWDNARGMFSSWQRDDRGRVATAIGITDDGTVFKGFDEKYWAAAIGVKSSVFKAHDIKLIMKQRSNKKWYAANNRLLDMAAVQVEICNAGYLKEENGKIQSWFGWTPPDDKILELDYKGYHYFEKYTDEEIETLKYWTLLQTIRFDIPLTYNHEDMWNVSKKALSGEAGLYTHNSYRIDKTDVSPQPHLIAMAKTLAEYMV